jgi:hypothetical protein
VNQGNAFATFLYVDDSTSDGVDLSTYFAGLGATGYVTVQSVADAGEWAASERSYAKAHYPTRRKENPTWASTVASIDAPLLWHRMTSPAASQAVTLQH